MGQSKFHEDEDCDLQTVIQHDAILEESRYLMWWTKVVTLIFVRFCFSEDCMSSLVLDWVCHLRCVLRPTSSCVKGFHRRCLSWLQYIAVKQQDHSDLCFNHNWTSININDLRTTIFSSAVCGSRNINQLICLFHASVFFFCLSQGMVPQVPFCWAMRPTARVASVARAALQLWRTDMHCATAVRRSQNLLEKGLMIQNKILDWVRMRILELNCWFCMGNWSQTIKLTPHKCSHEATLKINHWTHILHMFQRFSGQTLNQLK